MLVEPSDYIWVARGSRMARMVCVKRSRHAFIAQSPSGKFLLLVKYQHVLPIHSKPGLTGEMGCVLCCRKRNNGGGRYTLL